MGIMGESLRVMVDSIASSSVEKRSCGQQLLLCQPHNQGEEMARARKRAAASPLGRLAKAAYLSALSRPEEAAFASRPSGDAAALFLARAISSPSQESRCAAGEKM
ncbi:hypothetical protein NDU88_005537 [Pleurodeles waltl]|uniref:Uncharacterized protein n=1 Tax=Pleurodeles waltl TaxID=8319 RepID=A0AAV7TVQ8_PLEWA|nr:hypothetical protein NDU88_005537 [Pleurodeles waltl]